MPDTSLPGLGKPTAIASPVRPGQPAQPSAFGQLSGQGQPAAKPDLLGGMAQAKPEQLQQLAAPSATSPAASSAVQPSLNPQPALPSVTPSAAPPSGSTVPGTGSGGPLATAAPPPGGQPQLPGLPSALPPEGGAPPAAMPETPPQQPPGMLEQMFPKAPEPGMGNPAAKPSFTPGQEPGLLDKALNWAPDAMGLDSKEMHPILKGIMSIGGPVLLLMLLTKLFGGRGKEASLRDYTPEEQAEARRRLQRMTGTVKTAAQKLGLPTTPPATPTYKMPQMQMPDGPSVGTRIAYDPAIHALLQELENNYVSTGELSAPDSERLRQAFGWQHGPDDLDLLESLMEMEDAHERQLAAATKQADLTSDAMAGIDKMLASLGYAKAPAAKPAAGGHAGLLQALGLLGGSTALGAGFGALRKPGGSRLRGAVIGGTAGLAGGAGLLGVNEFMDSSHMRNVKDTSWQAPTVLGATAGATAGGVGLGRRLASALGLAGRKDNDPNNDLEELDLTRKFNITPFG